MMTSGDTKRSRSVKAEFDQDFDATAAGGGILAEKTMRSLGLRRYINKYLPPRAEAAEYIPREFVHTCHVRLAAILRSAGGTLRKQFGNDAGDILDESLDEFDDYSQKFAEKWQAKQDAQAIT